MQHPGLNSCMVTEKIVKLSCMVKSLYFTMAEPKRCYLVPSYILPPIEKTSSRCSKTLIIKLTITQMHTHYTQLYIAGNFLYLTDVVRISGREWGPTRPSHHLNLFPFMLFCHCGQSKQSLTKCYVFFQFPNVLHCHLLFWKSIQSCAIDYFKSHLLAQHSTNEGESATDIE